MKTKFDEQEINLNAAYQFGRVDALSGDQPDRFDGKAWGRKGPVPDGHCGCTLSESKIWASIRREYLAGYDAALQREAKIVAFARRQKGSAP